MALDDRDYMRNRHRRTFDRMTEDGDDAFAPPRDGPPWFLKVLACICVALVVYKAWAFWEAKEAALYIEPPSQTGTMLEGVPGDRPALPAGLPPLPAAAPDKKPF